jgi:hypothetical protein
MPFEINRYPLDPTGVSPDNLVAGEVHTPPLRKVRAIVPTHGAFFSESLHVFDASTQDELIKDVQFEAVEMYEVPTAMYGKEICSVILITDEAVGQNISITYQALGGEFSDVHETILDLLNRVDLDDRPVTWGNLLAKPSEFPPSHHLHDAGDVYGFEALVHACDRIRRAIELGDDLSHDRIFRYVDNVVNGLPRLTLEDVIAAIAPMLGNDPDFATTMQTLLAGKVDLEAKATSNHALDPLNDTNWMTPARTIESINAFANIAPASETIAGKVELATPAETVLGTSNSLATHPQGVKLAIQTALSALVNSAPGAMDQLNELAAAMGNDPNFATTLTNALALKAPMNGAGAYGTWGISVTGNSYTSDGLRRAGDLDGSGDYSYRVRTIWTGSRWRLNGYNGANALHAGCEVAYADVAGSANSIAWGNVAGRPTGVSHLPNDAGYITGAGYAFPRRADGAGMGFNWQEAGGQPTYLWGSNDGSNMFVWKPSSLNVNYASSAGTAANAGYATNAGNAETLDGYHAADFARSIQPINWFESGEYPIPAVDVDLTAEHELGAIPRFYSVTLRCVSAQNGYAVGDEVNYISPDGDGARGVATWASAIVLGFRFAAIPFLKNRAGGGTFSITPANWRVVFRAHR